MCYSDRSDKSRHALLLPVIGAYVDKTKKKGNDVCLLEMLGTIPTVKNSAIQMTDIHLVLKLIGKGMHSRHAALEH